MRHGSLFSGIGGFDLAAEWMGWENIFHCEWNPFGQKVLSYYWPKAISYHDITKTDFTIHRGQIDILTGGFPCQPYSLAGKRKGKEDDRHLWPEMLRAIREIQPRWVVGENVFGLVNWNDGLVFHEVQSDLEAEGYEVFPYVLPAVSVNAPHRRDRVWFVAYRNDTRNTALRSGNYGKGEEKIKHRKQHSQLEFSGSCNKRIASNTNSIRQHGSISEYEINASERGEYAQHDIGESINDGDVADTSGRGMEGYWGESRSWGFQTNELNEDNSKRKPVMDWEKFPTKSPICNGDDGLSFGLDTITFSKWRQESIKAGGNAVVPQVVFQIFKAIEQYETIA